VKFLEVQWSPPLNAVRVICGWLRQGDADPRFLSDMHRVCVEPGDRAERLNRHTFFESLSDASKEKILLKRPQRHAGKSAKKWAQTSSGVLDAGEVSSPVTAHTSPPTTESCCRACVRMTVSNQRQRVCSVFASWG